MGQNWKTLTLVVIGAAIAGWLMVRLLRHDPGEHKSQPIAVVASPAPQRTTRAPRVRDETPRAPTAAPRATVGIEVPQDDGEQAAIERDLQVLVQALARESRIEDQVMPRINDGLDVPGTTQYRRAPDFWEPAFEGAGGARR